MDESYFELISAIFVEQSPFFCLIWTLFGQFLGTYPYQWYPDYWMLNWIIFFHWISRTFELNNILNWILSESILSRILNDSFFGKIQTLYWIRWGIEQSIAMEQNCMYFLQNFGLKFLKPSETSKNSSGGPKNPEIIQKLSIFHFPNWRYHRKTCFSAPKGAISAKSTKSEKGVRLCNTACMGLPWKI